MIPMQLKSDILDKVTYLVGSREITAKLTSVSVKRPFDDAIVNFLNDVSRVIIKDLRSRSYSDVTTFGFWIRKGSLLKLKNRLDKEGLRLGKGVAFHIAPSNVPVNFAYSLVAGLLTGNANIVRVPSKEYPQIEILTDAINSALNEHPEMKSYILCVRYERDKAINDMFSAIADLRLIWGGDQTIAEVRKSELPPRSGEITFADRYSIAVIDADSYLSIEDKFKVAEDFYNDTFFTDQNACTSPRVIIWTGERIAEAKEVFWKLEHSLLEKKYNFQAIQAINKLTKAYLVATAESRIKVEDHQDNLIIRLRVPEITNSIIDYLGNSGYFYEYDCRDILDLFPLCNDKRCQTIAYIGDGDIVLPLLEAGVKGIDRIVPMGKTMDFDLIWDGYNLPEMMTRTVVIT